jgi:hypothetical protein
MPGHPQASRLRVLSIQLSLIGQACAFIGLVILFAACLLNPSDPTTLDALRGVVVLPDAFAGNMTFSEPRILSWSGPVNLLAFGDGALKIAGLIALAGIFAIIRRHWLFAGMALSFFLLPWGLTGSYFPMAPYVIALYAILFAVLHAPFSKRAVIGIVALLVLATPIVVGIVSDSSRSFGVAVIRGRYQQVPIANLLENAGKPKTERDDKGGVSTRISTLVDIDYGNAWASAYVAVQEQALRGNFGPLREALTRLDKIRFTPNATDVHRLDAIRTYAAVSGALGEVAKQAQLSSDTTKRRIAAFAGVLGLALCIVSPLVDRTGARLGRRAGRLSSKGAMVRENRSNLAASDAWMNTRQLDVSEQIVPAYSIALDDGKTILEAIDVKVLFYVRLAIALGVGAAAAALSAYFLWLPSPSGNSAFDVVALTPSVLAFAQDAKIAVVSTTNDHWSISWLWLPLAAIACLSVIILAARLSLLYGSAAVVAILLLTIVYALKPMSHSAHEMALTQVTTSLRSQIQQSAEHEFVGSITSMPLRSGPAVGLALATTDKISSFNDTGHKLPGATSKRAGGAAADPDIRVASAYALAQIAYLENQPAITSDLLRLISPSRELLPSVHRQRLGYMTEWAKARGYDVSSSSWFFPETYFSQAVRSLGRSLAWISAIAAVFTVLVLLGRTSALARRGRIRTLIQERSRVGRTFRQAVITSAY